MAVEIGKLADEIADGLKKYSMSVAEGVKIAADEVSAELFANTKRDAPKRIGKGGGKYRRAMAIKTVTNNAYGKQNVWYVKSPHYRLSHLLEHGHVKQNGGRVREFPHIEKNEEAAKNRFLEQVEEIIKNGGV